MSKDKIDYESPAMPRIDPEDDPAWNPDPDSDEKRTEEDRQQEAYEQNSD